MGLDVFQIAVSILGVLGTRNIVVVGFKNSVEWKIIEISI